MTFVLFLHVVAAVFLIGPLTVAAAASPAAIESGAEGLSLLRWLNRTTRFYGFGSVLVFLLGLALVRGDYSFKETWLTISMTLFVVALALLFLLVERDQRRAIRRLEEDKEATIKAGRILGVTAFVAGIWVVILLLMVFQPGHHDRNEKAAAAPAVTAPR
ncbi:MAG: hypothetical protein NVSMB13_03690 [Mycobacteriales bacterium]